MLTIIVGTNRPGSNSRKVASQVRRLYQDLGAAVTTLDLAELPSEIACRETLIEARKKRNHSSSDFARRVS